MVAIYHIRVWTAATAEGGTERDEDVPALAPAGRGRRSAPIGIMACTPRHRTYTGRGPALAEQRLQLVQLEEEPPILPDGLHRALAPLVQVLLQGREATAKIDVHLPADLGGRRP